MERPVPPPADMLDRLMRWRERVARVPDLVGAVLFGSFARGDATAWSDVDLGVVCGGPLDFDLRLDLLGDAAAIFGRDVDVVDLRTAPLPLRGNAVRDGIPLIVSDRDAWIEFVTRTTLEWLDYEPAYRRGIAIEVERLRRGRAA